MQLVFNRSISFALVPLFTGTLMLDFKHKKRGCLRDERGLSWAREERGNVWAGVFSFLISL
jgi:hypothetical protein